MKFERDKFCNDVDILYTKCKKFLYYHAVFTMKDYGIFDGIIIKVEEQTITVLVGKDIIETEYCNMSNRQQQDYENNNGIQRYRRFEPKNIPLNALSGLYLLPYPFIAPQYPYYPFHPAYHLDYPIH
ncbi:hypothetical protein CBU02nite_34720 [Clostridium butyricum]|uniref:Uncharacterized protein n=2 Tax=Clostridium butyricum TaxID=1492 RepID=A0A512TRW9_CLOBU|nr:hypothetical protein [Clostridium butyricum]NAS17459.1 hypothetical protein [Clostridium butyricum]NOW22631.1 DNA-binding ferritin-like protein (Dps family) [Clostridium butyricum]GEQ22966.1 hypothetical protein CBU02nite_34720 [Clostridium butyricum]